MKYRSNIVKGFKSADVKGAIYCDEALNFLKSLKSNSAGIIFLDPPFNLGKKYSDQFPKLDKRPEADYKKWMEKVLDDSIRVLAPGGALYLYHLPKWAMYFGNHLGGNLNFRHWIAISMKNGFVRGRILYPAHYSLLYFTKGLPKYFNRPKITPLICPKCKKSLLKDYGGYKKIIDEKGINLSDFWEDLSPVRHSNKKHRNANELPAILFQRILTISGSKGMIYVDPFAGTGTGIVEALKAGLRFYACDILASNCELIIERLSTFNKIKT